MPRVKVLNYLKKVALFFRFERDILADGAQVIGRDAEKRGEVLQCLVEFYALLRPMQWYQWEQRYHALTPKQVAFLILQDELHSTDDQIARALGITESTVRVVRSRIKGRER